MCNNKIGGLCLLFPTSVTLDKKDKEGCCWKLWGNMGIHILVGSQRLTLVGSGMKGFGIYKSTLNRSPQPNPQTITNEASSAGRLFRLRRDEPQSYNNNNLRFGQFTKDEWR